MGIHAQRETFREEDNIRIHPIITKGGDLVNIVPADVRIETFVRGKRIETILGVNEKVNAALKGGAMAIGAKVEIADLPGYLPVFPFLFWIVCSQIILERVVGKEAVGITDHRSGQPIWEMCRILSHPLPLF
jgi:metal-dependent amidase/aminoacylase/carboxypeptidase family protein